MEYEPVIGLEVHVQLKTRSKMFTRVAYAYGHEPNTLTNPVVMGMPGTLPVMNKEAVRKTVQLGLMLGCKIAETCKWDRKNYFYPDSPKNYQLSQFDQPICEGGEVEIEMLGASRNVMGDHRTVELTRIHLEEDVGKLTHFATDSLVDYNRAGAALCEIVTEPNLYSEDEVYAFMTALRNMIVTAGLSDCDMEKGQMRCDANISIRPVGSKTLGTKVELKNMNSISGVRNAVAYEIKRQIRALTTGYEKIVQETRRWDPVALETESMRMKEESHDYRYFPDPDLMPVSIPAEQIEKIRSEIPEMPFDRQRRYMNDMDLPYTITSVLCPERELAEFFEEALALTKGKGEPKAVANLVVNELIRDLSAAEGGGRQSLSECLVTPAHVAELVLLIEGGVITKQIGKDVWVEMATSGKMPAVIVDEKGLKASNDSGELATIVAQVVADPKHEKAITQFKEGNKKALNSLIGPVMKATQGKANPQQIQQLMREAVAKL
ncbi:Asp-tRNA(Asn)/Glu-tRNA(Gln) amidotransferase subunit GatB [Cerasicoccus arenae]|uniref:Aspartyl/glutamyl-tRNA(Asn/Gln) amidotransferase subunit B n=1 Tax=Cerasicoccus arenae TaxID=424488 RepID=A0A8J3GD73_9BACT|nr:Asp-tRNA(Asn)/Glu-tRNA(Gln) amidotransferase subunit GatB [Cerasicoccus arenae]MBK1856886.1 Asp-tRNA(Asn)/Glu-tRNA(Gln) amidotransferase subunit GatB [Cerasicoccus arenae]GHB89660.1 aspartyl/glutamyl-tRNA(Asn/Gln) amidotransferase subunit B [Cerasicoccus arenae]